MFLLYKHTQNNNDCNSGGGGDVSLINLDMICPEATGSACFGSQANILNLIKSCVVLVAFVVAAAAF